ncbi:uncharacterized protein Gasu_03060 [Galdieria sulphuraria]|uniref:Uncharacterized protein n=1 Tax=Galdieria sulphuraria TaxID=130081 RepID=M2W9G7_GALSU|nr:uncharacterized protein Gasu_03060 [Galdieria sulphuraria]EME32531.1 hypothetical protein Gasu_03060 [Galdieria sulphuraria]|eukprot:XP_005709051.1 hypothetical protein Gasu_03060 [Galdieria sulphuraria]
MLWKNGCDSFTQKRKKQKKSTCSTDRSLLNCGNPHILLDQLQFLNKQHQETSEKVPTAHFQETKLKVEGFLSKLREENEKLLQSDSPNLEPSQEEESFIEMNIFVDRSLGELVKGEEETCREKPLVEEVDNKQ